MRSISSRSRLIPAMLAAICARKSPAVSRFERIWGENQVEHVGGDPAPLDQLNRRDDDALLEDLLEGAAVDVVGDARHVTDQPAFVVHGGDHGDVVQVHAAAVGVVGDPACRPAQGLPARTSVPRLAPARPSSPGAPAG